MRRFLWFWLALLLASNLWRLSQPDTLELARDQIAIELAERDGEALTGRRIRVATRLYGSPENPPVLILHGTPVASPAMRGLAKLLQDEFYVISPDLPGFGRSSMQLPDYSSVTHASYVVDLLDSLNIDSAHVIGYSQGGAPAITIASDNPQRVRSVTLLAAIGVQELELFGSYTVNHAVYAGQLGLINACRWLLPHFGWLDGAILGYGYARNLTDTDQRLLREKLTNIHVPALIIHGRKDGLVPYAAAIEHARLIPHSDLVTVDAGHEIGYGTPELAMPALLPFIDLVEAGQALTKAEADPERVESARAPYSPQDREPLNGGALIVLLLAIVIAAYVSEDLTCIASGLLVAQGILSLPLAIAACLVGLFTSDVALFLVGRWFGAPAVRRLISDAAIERATGWLQKRGPLVIIISRFTPGTRLPTYLMAGALRMPAGMFIFYFAIATAIWTPILVSLAAAYGRLAEQWFDQYAAMAVWLFVGGAVALWFLIRIIPPLFTRRGRRLALGKWRRTRLFEYWPRWAFYAPVVLFNIGLAIRYRSLTLFSLANPAMPLAGLTGESKSKILTELASSGCVAPFTTLDVNDRSGAIQALDTFIDQVATHYPVVLKPDQGERGQDVCIVGSREEALSYLESATGSVIVQKIATGKEYGVLYVRMPDAPSGTLTSIAHKGSTVIRGDGTSTLESLILEDDRAVNMAPFFLDAHAADLQSVPLSGEAIRLNQIGTHSRGSIFTNARHLDSEALTAEIDRIVKNFEGFYIGRFDLFAADDEALSDGRGLNIVELNGLASEPAHIYHPGSAWLDAISATCQHWHHAWRIGAALRAQGHKAPGLRQFVVTLRALSKRH